MDKEEHTVPVRGALVFWHNLKQVFLQVPNYFLAKLGDKL